MHCRVGWRDGVIHGVRVREIICSFGLHTHRCVTGVHVPWGTYRDIDHARLLSDTTPVRSDALSTMGSLAHVRDSELAIALLVLTQRLIKETNQVHHDCPAPPCLGTWWSSRRTILTVSPAAVTPNAIGGLFGPTAATILFSRPCDGRHTKGSCPFTYHISRRYE